MRIGAFILGVLGGLIGVYIGLYGYTAGPVEPTFLAIPIASIVGGAIALASPGLGGALILSSAAGMLWMFGVNPFTVGPVLLSMLGGVSALFGIKSTSPAFGRFRVVFSLAYLVGMVVAGAWLREYVATAQIMDFVKMAAGWTAWICLVAAVYAGLEKLFPRVLRAPARDA